MKKYSLYFLLSFISYVMCIAVIDYFTERFYAERFYADIGFIFPLLCSGYLLLAVFWLVFWVRKKDNVKFGKALLRVFRYALLSLLIYCTAIKIHNMIFGMTISGCFGPSKVYYGIEAWLYDDLNNLVYPIVLRLNVAYNFVCFGVFWLIKKYKSKKASINGGEQF